MTDAVPIQNRVVELRRVRAGEILPDERNFRRHPQKQRTALIEMLEQIGYVNPVIARQTDNGLVLVDGHLRVDIDPEFEIPVVIVDLNDEEAGKALATLDPLAAMAETERAALAELVASFDDELPDITGVIEKTKEMSADPVPIPRVYQVIIECSSEAEQEQAYEFVTEEGYTCRVVTL